LQETIHHAVLAELDFDALAGLVDSPAHPALWVVGGTFLLGVAIALGAALFRNRHAPRSGFAGRVDCSSHRPVDAIGVGWIVGIYLWLSLAQLSFARTENAREIGTADLWVSIAFQCVMAGMVILVMSPRIRMSDWLGLRRHEWKSLILLAPFSVAVMWVLFAVLQAVGYTDWLESLDFETMQDSVKALQKQNDVVFLALMRFSAVIVAPICEEVVFRGYLYGVAKRYCGPVVAALASALIFSAAHASVAALLPLALFGLLLVWLYERTGSLWAPVAAHACFNAATVVVLMIQ